MSNVRIQRPVTGLPAPEDIPLYKGLLVAQLGVQSALQSRPEDPETVNRLHAIEMELAALIGSLVRVPE